MSSYVRWFRTDQNQDVNTRLFACLFACSAHSFTCVTLLASHSSHTRVHSCIRSLTLEKQMTRCPSITGPNDSALCVRSMIYTYYDIFFCRSRITGTQVVFRWRQIRTGRCRRRRRRSGRHSSDGLTLVQSRIKGRIHGPSFSQRRQHQPGGNVRHHGSETSLESTPEERGQKERQEGGQEPTGLRELSFASFGAILCYFCILDSPHDFISYIKFPQELILTVSFFVMLVFVFCFSSIFSFIHFFLVSLML